MAMKKRFCRLSAAMLLLSLAVSTAAAETVEPYGRPWLTSIVDGMVTEELPKPELRDDYFLNCNYEWLRDTALKPGHSQDGGLVALEGLVAERVDSLFTDESIKGRGAELVREFYQMFLDWDSRADAWQTFLAQLRPVREIASLEDLTAYITGEESVCRFGPALCQATLYQHVKHPDQRMVNIGWTNLSLTDSAEYAKQTPYGTSTRKFHDGEASFVLRHAGFSEDEIAEIVRQRYEFEAMLAPFIMTDEAQSEAGAMERRINIRSRDELMAVSPAFPIAAILDRYDFNPELEINLEMPRWLEKLNELYTEENVPLMRSYLLYEKAFYEIGLLDEDCYREYQKQMMEYKGMTETDADEDAAREFAQTFLSEFIDEMYVEKYTSEKMREDVLAVIRDVIAAYRGMLLEENWLTEETREKAVKKLDTMTAAAVYPNAREDWSGYTFRSRSEGGNLMEAYSDLRYSQWDLLRKNSYSKPVPGIWSGGAAYAVNAKYDKQNNSINIYAGILNGDVYRENMTREELLAGAGTIIAHEISHAFDTEGSRFDETGAFRNWWTDADQAAFERRAGKLIAYYDSLYPWKDGSPYSGTMVQEEAIADLGSMACILRIAEKTENFDYDAFFRAYAQLRRRKMTETAFENGFRTNVHPMDHLRVNVVLAQFPEFQQTYGIRPGDGMYVAPEDRIAIWGMDEQGFAGGENRPE